jgi:hypothetical protein
VSTAGPARPRRGAAWPPTRDGSRAWALLQRALSVTVVGAAVITGVQLGVNAPAVSPVQPTTVSVVATPNSSTVLAAPNQQALPAPGRDGTARGRGRGGR